MVWNRKKGAEFREKLFSVILVSNWLKLHSLMMSQSIFPPINFLIQNSALLSSFAAQKALNNGCPSGSSLAALEKLSKAFRRPDLQIEKLATSSCMDKQKDAKMSTVVPSRNRYGRPYISGRPLLTCDRQKIVECYKKGMKKIHIAKQLGITHSCVSKVLRSSKSIVNPQQLTEYQTIGEFDPETM
ncbi:CBN-NPAX-4 protein [Caenorhabditis brenneri]|uniref:CBN-NPAX-4 protein n=1 Tax=Caenorhabditis brenneri TaxID=135651 RepID=G0PIG5_CAEBE|nr:CBN-NPAX-4 protein [Caenorhabditis brenneri]